MVISTTESNKNQQQNLCYIYRHIRLDKNEVFYIGKGTNVDGKYTRAYSKDRVNPHWHRIVKKHDHEVEIMLEGLSGEEANKKEVEFILLYGRRDLKTGTLVNMTDGGEGARGAIRSPESREKNRKAQTGKKASEETRKKMREWKRTPEHMEKLAQSTRGRTQTEEHRRKNSEGQKGRKHTEESKKKMSIGQRSRTDCKKPVGQYKEGVLIKTYPSRNSVELDGYDPQQVGACCIGKQKSHKGYEWRYFIDGVILDIIDPYVKKDDRKQIAQYTSDYIFIRTYESIRAVTKDGFNRIMVSRCVNGKAKLHKGFIWKLV